MKKTLIERIEVGSGGAATIEFTSIPQTYAGLYLVCSVRNTSSSLTFDINPNGSTTNKTRTNLQGAGSGTPTSATGTDITPLQNSNSFTSNTFASTSVLIPNYASSNNKGISIDTVTENNATTSYQRLQAALWSDTTAISSLECSTANNFAQYSSFTLYGVTSGSDGTTTVS